jgi:hypothetical protein
VRLEASTDAYHVMIPPCIVPSRIEGMRRVEAVGAPAHRSSGSGASGRCTVGRRHGAGASGQHSWVGTYLTCVLPMGLRPTPHRPSSQLHCLAFPSISQQNRNRRNRRLPDSSKLHVELRLGRVTALNRFESLAVQQRIFFFTLNNPSCTTLLSLSL